MQLIQAVTPQNVPAKRRYNSSHTPWTGPRIDLLIALWAEGLGATCPVIAARLNELPGEPITEDAVAGKVYRLGLAPKDPAILWQQIRASQIRARIESGAGKTRREERAERGIAFQKKRAAARKKCNPLPAYTTDNVIPLRVPFDTIDNHQCHYVVGEVADLVYCGRARAEGSRWCEGHRERCTQRPRR